MFLCYFEFGSNKNAPVNSHKILEFLALGKVVISNYFEDYKSYNDELIFMPEKITHLINIKNLSLLLMIYINLIITTSSKRGVTMPKNVVMK